MKKILTLVTATLIASFNHADAASTEKQSSPKNIIMVVADGMGPVYTTAYRYFNDDPATEAVETTLFDKYLVGMASTYPAPVSGYVTDSAAGATALATGVKSYNKAISVDVNKKPLLTVLEQAKMQGMKTGVVVTSQVNHATPASYLSHNESRHNYNEIADTYVDATINDQFKFDVLLGGGWRYFIREDRNLVEEFKKQGVQYIDNYQQLSSLNNNSPALGLFGDKGLPYSLDDTNTKRLSLLTKTATNLLENEQGYFLLIEASQVDWAGHSNDIAAAMWEMDDLAYTLSYLETYVENHPDTIVILTADHSTGGLSLGADGDYLWQPDILKQIKNAPNTISKKLLTHDINSKTLEDFIGFPLTNEEMELLKTAKAEAVNSGENNYRIINKQLKAIIDARTTTGWTSGGHTAVDVPVISFGKNSNIFSGHIDNTDVAKKIFSLLKAHPSN